MSAGNRPHARTAVPPPTHHPPQPHSAPETGPRDSHPRAHRYPRRPHPRAQPNPPHPHRHAHQYRPHPRPHARRYPPWIDPAGQRPPYPVEPRRPNVHPGPVPAAQLQVLAALAHSRSAAQAHPEPTVPAPVRYSALAGWPWLRPATVYHRAPAARPCSWRDGHLGPHPVAPDRWAYGWRTALRRSPGAPPGPPGPPATVPDARARFRSAGSGRHLPAWAAERASPRRVGPPTPSAAAPQPAHRCSWPDGHPHPRLAEPGHQPTAQPVARACWQPAGPPAPPAAVPPKVPAEHSSLAPHPRLQPTEPNLRCCRWPAARRWG